MRNLIQNSQWCPGPGGGPRCFSGCGTTYDSLCINNHRTCSITQDDCGYGFDQYDPMIPVKGECCIQWGYTIRAVEASCIKLVADFYDQGGQLLETQACDITARVCCGFSTQTASFKIPCCAACVKLSLQFHGKVTACTFYAPTACFC